MKVEQIELHAEAIVSHRALIAIPSAVASSGPTLELVCYEEQGYQLRIIDPIGGVIFERMLNAEEGVNGPNFGADAT